MRLCSAGYDFERDRGRWRHAGDTGHVVHKPAPRHVCPVANITGAADGPRISAGEQNRVSQIFDMDEPGIIALASPITMPPVLRTPSISRCAR